MSQALPIDRPAAGPTRPFPWAAVWVAALAVVFAVQIVQVNRRISHGHSGDFRHFYYAARAVIDGTDPYTSGTQGYLYPPLIAVLYTPLATLPYVPAQRVAVGVDVALIAVGVALASRSMRDRFNARPTAAVWAGIALLAVLADVDKVRNELQMFQTNALQLALFALSLYWLDRRPALAGVPLGAILNIKYLSLATVPWLLLRRRWATAASTLASGVAFALLPAGVVGWRNNLRYLGVAYGGLATMVGRGHGTGGPTEQANVESITDLLSCSLTSAGARLAKWNGWPLPAGLTVVAAVVVAVVIGVLLMYRRRGMPAFAWPPADAQRAQPWRAVIGVEFVAVLMGTLIFSPQTNSRHLSLAVLLTAAAAALLVGGRPGVPRAWVAAALVFMFLCFVLPPGNKNQRLSDLWFGIGGPCWGLLAAVLAVVWAGLRQATLLARPTSSVAGTGGFPVVV